MHVRKAGRGQWSRMLSARWPAAAARTQQGTMRRLGPRGAQGSARGQVRRQHETSAARETPQEHTDLRGDVAYEDLGAILARRHRGGGVRPVADLHARASEKEEAFPRGTYKASQRNKEVRSRACSKSDQFSERHENGVHALKWTSVPEYTVEYGPCKMYRTKSLEKSAHLLQYEQPSFVR